MSKHKILKEILPQKKIDVATKIALGERGYTNYCLFCGTPRLIDNEQKWASKLTLQVGYYCHYNFTICPQCRKKHTISDIYGELVSAISHKWTPYQKNLKP